MTVESAKGECNLGQHEIAFRYDEATVACDNHVIYKNGAKEIAAQEGTALTFMAKFDEREGNSCHIHLSFRGTDGALVMADDSDEVYGMSAVGRSFVAGQLAHMRELTLLFAPNINSYKRYVAGSFAPTAIKWGPDNRTCALRLVGHGPGLRLENRVPGGDVNPYLAVAGMVAAGLDGIERELELEDAFDRQRLRRPTPSACPTPCAGALELWESSDVRARRPSATRSSTTTPTWPRSRSPPSTRPSPTGSASGASSGCDHDDHLALERQHVRRRQPGDRAGRPHGRPRRRRARPTRPIDAAGARLPGAGAALAPGRPRPAAAAVRRRRRRPPRGAGAARGRQLRPHDRQRAVGGGQRPRRPALLQRGAGAAVRPADPGRRRRRRHLQGAARRRRRHRAVELPDADRRLGLRARAGRRQHRGAQARRADPADRDPARRARAGGRAPRGRLHGDPRQGVGGRASASSRTRWCARSSSPARPRSASASWPAAPRR